MNRHPHDIKAADVLPPDDNGPTIADSAPSPVNAVVLRVMLTALVVLVGMTTLEAIKQLTSLDLSFWQMQGNTVLLIALVATLTAHFSLRQYRRVMTELEAWQEKLRQNNERLALANTQLSQANAQLKDSNTALQSAIEEREAAQAQLMHSACYDALTQLPNRALFISRLEQAIARAQRRNDYQFAVLFLDLDGFKIVNDSLGHLLGDQLLIEVARRLSGCLRATDTCARLGGDEFTILLDDIQDTHDATRVAERLQSALGQSYSLEDAGAKHEVFPSASIGIALSRTGYQKPEDVLRDADTAMYRAKGAGRSLHETFDPQMHVQAMKRLHMEHDLRHALEAHQFIVHYQPIVALESGRLVGFEALSRWISPERGLIPPAEFIPVAEETGLIVPLDRGALLSACLQMSAWQREYPQALDLTLSVNLSTKHFAQPDLVAQISRVLEVSGLQARTLKLEITESAIMQQPERVAHTLRELRALPVQISLDDFGTGYSSLSYLHRFPLDTLKIDRSFISRLGEVASDGTVEETGILQTIISLAQHLDMEVIAEGVETQAQAAHLRALGCRYAQGYLYSRPVDAEAAARMLVTLKPTAS